MADGSDGTDASPESEAAAEKSREIWGTLEELLLACAVTRHGTSSWDSVAMEVQTRSPLAARPGLTPSSCRLRFRHLHRRFSTVGSGGEEEVEEGEDGDDPDASAAEGWVAELRRLRVAELRRDVERCDLSIGTLQSKVQRLREERERSVSGSGEAKPDEASGNDRLSGEEPGRSCRESNSTDLKPPKHPGGKSSVVKEEEEASGESAAASKDSSDVRSSVNLSSRRRRRGKTSGADEEEAASAPFLPPARSPSLAALLDAVAAKLGPVMERLREHESEEYRGTIRRHVDLEVVRSKLEASTSTGSCDDDDYPASEFYRDLLLLCTNAAVFFPRSEPEHAAAVEARALVSEHASAVLREPKREEHAVAVPTTPAGGDIVGPLIEKGKPLIVCRKRSSIAKAAAMKTKEISTENKGEAEKAHEASEEEEKQEAVEAVTGKDKAWGLRTKKKRGGAVRRLAGTRLTDDTAAADDGANKDDKKGGTPAKKRNAVDFLKRLNQQGSSATKKKRGSPLGTTRRRSAAAATTEEQPKTTRKRGTGRKDGTGRGGGKRGGRAGVSKRGVGRPLKRGAGPATPPPSKRAKTSRSDKPATGKRGGRRSAG